MTLMSLMTLIGKKVQNKTIYVTKINIRLLKCPVFFSMFEDNVVNMYRNNTD